MINNFFYFCFQTVKHCLITNKNLFYMNLKPRVDKSFLIETSAKKADFGIIVCDALDANAASYPNLPVTSVDLRKITNRLADLNVSASSGDHLSILERNALEKEWNNEFSLTANYVTFLANGNELIITNAGFKATKSVRATSIPPVQVVGIIAASTSKTNLHIEWTLQKSCTYSCLLLKKGFGADVSLVNGQIAFASPENVVAIKNDTHNKIDFQGLTSLTEVDIVVYAINVKGAGALSLPVTATII